MNRLARIVRPNTFAPLRFPVRFQSTERKEPQVVAQSLLEKLPGDSLAAKSSTFMVGASVAAFLVSKEIYIIDAEFFEMLCLFGAYYVWYSNGKDVAAQYFKDKQQTIKRVLEQAREDHKTVVKERMDHIGKLSNTVQLTEELYDVAQDILKLEAEVYELKQKAEFTSQVKGTLDAWVRQEAAVREAEQKKVVTHVIENVKAKLQDPKMQQTILAQNLAALENLKIAQ